MKRKCGIKQITKPKKKECYVKWQCVCLPLGSCLCLCVLAINVKTHQRVRLDSIWNIIYKIKKAVMS